MGSSTIVNQPSDELICFLVAKRSLPLTTSFLCEQVVVDNYLDGGMHVPYAHKGLGSTLDFDSYKTTVYNGYSTQICLGSSQNKSERVGEIAMYAHIYPNLMINRYGPWCDTNVSRPIDVRYI